MAALGMGGFLSATVNQAANLLVPFRSANREFHSSCRVWEDLPTKQEHSRLEYKYVSSIPLIKRNPTKIVTFIWILLIPVAIGGFFLTKNYLEKKRLRMMKLHREMKASSQKN